MQVAQRTGRPGGGGAAARRAGRAPRRQGRHPVVLDVIASLGHVELKPDGSYEMAARARAIVDPGSDHYLGNCLADTTQYWQWWGSSRSSATGRAKRGRPPVWHRRGQTRRNYDSAEVAKAVPLPARYSLLDGAHGEYSMALCRHHDRRPPGQRAHRPRDRLRGGHGRQRRPRRGGYVRGRPRRPTTARSPSTSSTTSPPSRRSARSSALPPCCAPARRCACSTSTSRRRAEARLGSILGLFFHLTSGADTYPVEQVSGWLADSGFGPAEKLTLPNLAMVSVGPHASPFPARSLPAPRSGRPHIVPALVSSAHALCEQLERHVPMPLFPARSSACSQRTYFIPVLVLCVAFPQRPSRPATARRRTGVADAVPAKLSVLRRSTASFHRTISVTVAPLEEVRASGSNASAASSSPACPAGLPGDARRDRRL